MEVGFVGLGLMGTEMCQRMCDSGTKVRVWNRTVSKTEAFLKANPGAQQAADFSSLLQSVNVVYLMLDTFKACEAVLSSAPDKLKGKTIVNHATIGVQQVRDLCSKVEENGGKYLAAPVLGSIPQVTAGKLQILAAGEEGVYKDCEECFKQMGLPRYLGTSVTQAAVYKLALNNIIGAQVSAFAASVGAVQNAGADVDVFMDVLQQGPFMSQYFTYKLPLLKTRDFTPAHFTPANMAKDLSLFSEVCKETNVNNTIVDTQCNIFQLEAEQQEKDGNVKDVSSVYNTIVPK